MLASITPLGERGRKATWAITVTAFALGARWRGRRSGALLGLAGVVLAGRSRPERGWGCWPAAAAGRRRAGCRARARCRDRGGRSTSAGWTRTAAGCTGCGYGAQLGVGVTTVVTSAATYVALCWPRCSAGDPGPRARWSLGGYGAVRGLTPLAAARVRRRQQLLAIHARLRQRRGARHGVGCGLTARDRGARGRWRRSRDPRGPRRAGRAAARLERARVPPARAACATLHAGELSASARRRRIRRSQHGGDAGRRRRSSR